MKTALFLTLARIFISPIFLIIYLFYQDLGIPLMVMPYCLLFLLTLCELSDIFDGVFARRSNQVTELGKILDPMADSIVRLSVLLTFTQGIVHLPMLLALVFVFRDAMISTLRTICALRGIALAARASGKLKAILQGASIFLIVFLMIPYASGFLSLELFQRISFWIVALTALYTVTSGIEYLWNCRKYIRQSWVIHV